MAKVSYLCRLIIYISITIDNEPKETAPLIYTTNSSHLPTCNAKHHSGTEFSYRHLVRF